MTHPLRNSLLLSAVAVLLVSVGCRGSRTHDDSWEGPPLEGPIYDQQPYDSPPYGPPSYGSPMYEDGGDSGALRPVPSNGGEPRPSRTDRPPILLPGPGADGRGRPAPPTTGAMPIEGDRGLMPASGRNEGTGSSSRFWPFGKSDDRRTQPPESERWPRDPNGAQRRIDMMPPPAPGITKRLRDEERYLARQDVERNPVHIEGLEFDASPTELAGVPPRFESNRLRASPRLVIATDATADTNEEWRLAEGGSVVEVDVDAWPYGAPRSGTPEVSDQVVADDVRGDAPRAVPVSATDAGARFSRTPRKEEQRETIPYDLDAPLPVITPGLQRSEPRYLSPASAPARRVVPHHVSRPVATLEREPESAYGDTVQPPILAGPGTNPLID